MAFLTLMGGLIVELLSVTMAVESGSVFSVSMVVTSIQCIYTFSPLVMVYYLHFDFYKWLLFNLMRTVLHYNRKTAMECKLFNGRNFTCTYI